MHTLKIIGLAVIAPLPTGIYFLAKKLGASHRKSMWLAVPVGLVATVMLLGAMSGGSNTGGGAHIIVTHSGGTVIGTPLDGRATFTIATSSTTMNCATTISANPIHRLRFSSGLIGCSNR